MNAPLGWYLLFLGLVALERGAELLLSERNARRALAAGAVEHGRGHYPAMVLVHALFLVACAAEALLRPAPPAPALAAAGALTVLAAQALRWWAVAALGDRWSTRVVVRPGRRPATGGPYRHLRHPNYLAVIAEVAALPLTWGSWRTALAFSLANAVLLRVRIRAEERALGPGWAAAFAGRPRLLPGRPGGRE